MPLNRRLGAVILRTAVSVVLSIGILFLMDWTTIGRLARTVRPEPVLAALFLVMAQQYLSSIKLSIALSKHSPGIVYLLRINLITAFFLNVLPTSVGGDVVRVANFRKKGRMRERATAAVVIDRYTGLIAQVLLICLFSLFSLGRDHRSVYTLCLAGSMLVLIAAITVLLHRFGKPVNTFLRHHWRFSRFFDLSRTVTAIGDLFKNRKRFGYVLAVSLLFQFLVIATIVLVSSAIGEEIPFYSAASISLAVTCVAMIPVSIAGWGVFELTYMGLYSMMTEHKEAGTLVSLGIRALMIVPSLIGMVLFLDIRRRKRETEK